MKYEVVPALPEHVEFVAKYMREADRREVKASHGHTPEKSLSFSVECTPAPLAGLANGKAMCVFGIATGSFLSLDGSPWLLGHEDLHKHAKAFLRLSRDWVHTERWNYRRLVNYVDERNTQSVKWIKWLGFHVYPAKEFGAERLPFHKFEWVRPKEEPNV